MIETIAKIIHAETRDYWGDGKSWDKLPYHRKLHYKLEARTFIKIAKVLIWKKKKSAGTVS